MTDAKKRGAGYFYIFLMFMTIIIVVFVFQMILVQWGTTSMTKLLSSINDAKSAVETVCDQSFERSDISFYITIPTNRMIIMYQCSEVLSRDKLTSPDQEAKIDGDYMKKMKEVCEQDDDDFEKKSLAFAWGETKLDQNGWLKTLKWFVRGVGFALAPMTGGLSAVGGWFAGSAIGGVGQHTVVKDLQIDIYHCDYEIPVKAFFRPSKGQSMTAYRERLYVVSEKIDPKKEEEKQVVRLQHVIE
jgi:hypothetical protein